MSVVAPSNRDFIDGLLGAGGTGYVLKSAARTELLEAVVSVLKGRIYITPSLSGEDLERFRDPTRAAGRSPPQYKGARSSSNDRRRPCR
jgi:DNA-binding NarL/FixJ family response regulator